jgi:hypothetical protein
MRNIQRWVLLVLFLLAPAVLPGSVVTINFEGFPNDTILTNQYPGLMFSRAIILTPGIGLDEREFPPYSGTNVAWDNGGSMSIVFSNPIEGFNGFFTYAEPLTLEAYGVGGNLLTTTHSTFSSNEGLSGVPGSSPNEFLHLTSASAISLITLTADPAGDSFAMSDMTYVTGAAPVPEPRTALLSGLGFFLILTLRHRRSFPKTLFTLFRPRFYCGGGDLLTVWGHITTGGSPKVPSNSRTEVSHAIPAVATGGPPPPK